MEKATDEAKAEAEAEAAEANLLVRDKAFKLAKSSALYLKSVAVAFQAKVDKKRKQTGPNCAAAVKVRKLRRLLLLLVGFNYFS